MGSVIHDPRESRRVFAVLWIVFFFQGMTPGFWVPSLTNILTARGLSGWVTLAFLVPPLCALVAPLVGGALADQRVSANRLFVWSSFASALALGAAFLSLDAGWNPLWFVFFLGLHSLASGPSWGLLATISLTHLRHGESRYPLVRVGATIGWVAGGLVTSFLLKADSSVLAGYASLVSKVLGALIALLVLGALMSRFRVKTMLLWALGLCAMRYGMSAVAGWNGNIAWHISGIAFHGICYTFYFITSQVFLDRRVDPEMKGQAQGLLSMVANGIGPLLGALLCGWLRHTVVQPDGSGWDLFWSILGGIIALCFVVFALCYRGQK